MTDALNAYQETSSTDWRDILRKNQQRTRYVFAAFILLYIVIGLCIDVLIYREFLDSLPISQILYGLLSLHYTPWVTLFATAIALVSIVVMLLWHKQLILLGTQAKQINPGESLSPEEEQLFNVVEEMKLAAGMNFMPRIYIIDAAYMNAFASGYSEGSALIAVTSELLKQCDREELQAIVAHELSHIKHLDIRLTLVATVLANLLVMLVDALFWTFLLASDNNNSNQQNDRTASPGYGSFAGGGMLFFVVLLRMIVPVFTVLLMLFLSRSREYMADAGAVELMRQNEPLARALLKIKQHHADHSEAINQAYAQTPHEAIRRESYIFDPLQANVVRKKTMSDWFSTHPGIDKRLAAIGFRKQADKPR